MSSYSCPTADDTTLAFLPAKQVVSIVRRNWLKSDAAGRLLLLLLLSAS